MRILRILVALFLIGPGAVAFAQQPPATDESKAATTPVLSMTLDKDSVVPGQPLVLRVKVLVPTFLPKPPVFPSFEVPGVMVRLPERASGPTSEKIDRETWSGVIRSYRLMPMVPGRFRIPSLPLTVTYADPDTNAPLAVELMTDEISFEGITPAGAEDLDPFIAAEDLVIEQTVKGEPASLAAGDSVERTVTARITGTSPLFLPPLIPPLESDGVAVYPAEPTIEETVNRGVFSGVRVERVTYVAEVGGRATAPSVSLRWFNIETQQVETATAPEIDFAITGPATPAPAFDWRATVPIVIVGLVLIAILAWFARLIWLRIAAWQRRRHAAWLSSEAYAYLQADAAVRRHRFNEATSAITRWSSLMPGVDPVDDERLAAAMAGLGARSFGREATAWVGNGSQAEDWMAVRTALRAAREGCHVDDRSNGHALPPLNPVS